MNSRLNSILAFDKLLLLAVVVLLAMGLLSFIREVISMRWNWAVRLISMS